MDVHKDSITIAAAPAFSGPDPEARVIELGRIPHDYASLERKLARLQRPDQDGAATLCVCYEAGPTGYELHRWLEARGHHCLVIAPSLTPTRSGDRVKTDRRDAAGLAVALRADTLTAVHVPDVPTEAVRDLERARDAAKRAERVARQQLDKFLLRHGDRYEGGRKWTQAHLQWIHTLRFEQDGHRRLMADAIKTVEDATERVERLTVDLAEVIAQTDLSPLATALGALRGVAELSAAVIAAEVGDLRRFRMAKQFMSYVGLTPSENSSGERTRRGSITCAGNGRLRWILVEAAWHYRHRPAVGKALRARQQAVAEPVRQIAWKAQKRLHRKFRHLTEHRGRSSQIAVIAVARELAGFVWAIGQQDPLTR
ncbi:MAG: IS110 family transposase [Planctomycetota bacterium]|nr:MAG: IS110 family transposase [Planctomycetota bacterium]REK37342.1 MAG: IS110 family transposase [Planctomycetota bacterium]